MVRSDGTRPKMFINFGSFRYFKGLVKRTEAQPFCTYTHSLEIKEIQNGGFYVCKRLYVHGDGEVGGVYHDHNGHSHGSPHAGTWPPDPHS